MVSEEELNLLKNNFAKIRVWNNDDGTILMSDSAQNALQFVNERIDIVKENFSEFIKAPTSIMYPDEFIRAVMQLNGGKELIFDNIDEILKRNNYKKDRLVIELVNIDGIGEVLAQDFETRFNLFLGRAKETKRDYSEYINSPMIFCSYEEQCRYRCFLNAVLQNEDASEILEKYKDVIVTPKFNIMMPELLKMIASRPDCGEFIRNNFEQIKSCAMEKDVVCIYKLIKDIHPEEYAKHKFIIEQIYDATMENIENHRQNETEDDREISISQTKNTCGRIIVQNKSREVETLLQFMAPDGDFEIKHAGGYAIAIKAGERFLKIGADRQPDAQFEIINHPRLLRPIIRKKDVSTIPNHPLYFEIQDEVDTETEITDEELLMVYKELREAGIRWCDAKKNNLGRLKKDNYGYPMGLGVPSNNESLGLIGDDSDTKVLKAGELVILDLDLLYPADYPKPLNPQAPECIVKYEAEFVEKEKQKKLVKEKKPDYGEK